MIVTGTSADGTAVTLSQGITIADPAATLPRTGAPDLSGLLVLAGAALLGGAVLLTRRRRAHCLPPVGGAPAPPTPSTCPRQSADSASRLAAARSAAEAT